ncbi:MAG TPA: hypothetical protein VH969_11815 [Actinophytocola sp.]|jgi:hypothetical protein|uniref:hypothetical protein n=1 Tax=Actinophytocola sp. TaxID=1872138 RepID=UPI002F9316DB
MDVEVAREVAAALVLFGATGTVSMTVYQLALKSFDVDLLPAALAGRVRWWRGHRLAATAFSACLLVLGLLGLLVL